MSDRLYHTIPIRIWRQIRRWAGPVLSAAAIWAALVWLVFYSGWVQ